MYSDWEKANRIKMVIKSFNIDLEEFTPEVFKNMLRERIESTKIEMVKNDVSPFW